MARLDDQIEKIKDGVDKIESAIHQIDKNFSLHKAVFDEHVKQDESMYQELKRMNDILQTNTESLKEHMHRTDLLEQMVRKMDERFTPIEIEHIKKEAVGEYVKDKMVLVAKIAGALTAGGVILAVLRKLLLALLAQ
jgi:type I site-specific restriction endonuclease